MDEVGLASRALDFLWPLFSASIDSKIALASKADRSVSYEKIKFKNWNVKRSTFFFAFFASFLAFFLAFFFRFFSFSSSLLELESDELDDAGAGDDD